MRILQLGKFYPIVGGIEKVMYDLLMGLSARSIHCDMLCASFTFSTQVIKMNEYAKIICVSTWFKLFSTMISPGMIWRLWKMKNDYDIIHIHHPDPMAALALFCSNYKGKVILHWHSDILKQRFMLRLLAPLQNWLIRRADMIIGTTPVYTECSPFLKSVQHKIICLPIGVDPISPDSEQCRQIRDMYKGKKIIFSLGRLVAYKGFKYLIEATEFLPDDYVVLIGGGGPLRHDLDRQIEEHSLQDKVKLLGYVPDQDLPGYFGACDVFCLSSIWKTEAFAIVQVEAMSCGKPVVATRIDGSGVSWVNADGVSGINVSVENAQELAEAILNLLSDDERYQEFSQRALKRYETMFTKTEMIDNCIAIYNSLK